MLKEDRQVADLITEFVSFLDYKKIGVQPILWRLTELVSNRLALPVLPESVTIENLQISKAVVPVPGYKPGVFPSDFSPISSIEEMTGQTPMTVFVDFIVTMTGSRTFKVKGMGELDIRRTKKGIRIRARNKWEVEEILEISPRGDTKEERKGIQRVEKVTKFIVEKIIAPLLAGLASGYILLRVG